MTAPSLALLPSPLLGPPVWQPVADVLANSGWHTVTCAAPARLGTGQDVLDAFLAALPTDRDLVLVPHSNAGAYVPALMQHRPVLAAIFVDAELPPARGRVPLAPPAFLDLLREKADGNGLLPMWSNWWDEANTAALFPDSETRARVEREQHRLPLSYFEGSLPVAAGWDERPGAYLAFGDTYGRERDEAERRQWPVSTLPGKHLHLLNDPDQVAAKLVDLMGPAAVPGTGPCIQLKVLASLENADMVRSLAAAYMAKPRNVDGKCVTLNVTQEKSGVAAVRRAGQFDATPAEERPAVWLPDSTAWLRIAKVKAGNSSELKGGGFEEEGASAARSGIVVAMLASLAQAIGWDTKAPSWADVFKAAEDPGVWERLGHADWGKFKFGKASPTVSTSGLMGLVASYGVAGENLKDMGVAELGKASVVEEVRAGELSTSHYMATPEHFLWHARQADDPGKVSEFLSAVIVDEKSVWDYNRGISSNDGVNKQAGTAPKEPLLAIYPNDGVLVADNPAAIVKGDWVSAQQQLAAKDFIAYAGTEQGQTVVKASGYRSIQDKVDPLVEVTGRYKHTLDALPLPPEEVLVTVHKSFPEVRKRARALFLLDVSGSMGQEIAPGLTRLQGAKDAVTKAMDHFTGDDQLGMAAFSHVEGGELSPGLVSPVAPFKTNKADLLAKLNGLQPVAYTPLFEAVGKFATQQASEYDRTAINTIVLLSDGKNDTPHAGSLNALTEQLNRQHHTTPVLVFTLAYGAGADTDSLRTIAKASGAHFYDATDPRRLEAVLGDLVTSF